MKEMYVERCLANTTGIICRSILVICLLFEVQICKAQISKIDSLKLLLHNENSTTQIDALFQLSRHHLGVEKTEMAKYYAYNAYLKAEQLGDTLRIVKTGRLYGQTLRRLSKLDSALQVFEKILPIAKRGSYNEEVKSILNGMALVHDAVGRFDKALQYHFESVELKKKEQDKFGLSVTFNNIARIYQDLRDYDQALKYYHESERLKEQIGSKFDLDRLFFNIAQCYAFSGNFDLASRYIGNGFATCLENCEDDSRIVAYQTMGYLAYSRNDYLEAKRQYLLAFKLSKRAGFENYLLESIEFLVKIAVDQNRMDEAEEYLKGAELLISSGTPYNMEIVQVFNQMQSLFSRYKDYEKAYFYQNKYVTLKDSIYNYELTTNLMKIEAAYLEKENSAKIKAQNEILALNVAVIFRQKCINVFIGIIASLLITLTLILRRINRQKQTINSLLDRKVGERTRALESTQSLLQKICEEREILMTKTANDINQTLATIKGLCLLGERDAGEAQSYLRKVNLALDIIFIAINRLRSINQTANTL